MMTGQDAKWMQVLARKFPWLAIPNIAGAFVAIQAVGFLLAYANAGSIGMMVLEPSLVFRGEIWRLVSFLAIPVSLSPIGILFGLSFAYFILNSIEAQWGSFKTTLYVVVSIFLTVVFALVFDYPIVRVTEFVSTFFLAAAALFPEEQINLYMVIPVKMKFLGWLALAYAAYRFVGSDWMDRFFLVVIYSNYLLFFGPSLLYRIRQYKRRRDFKSNWR